MRVISGSARGTVLHSIEDISTRPTLDRVKESLFNIIQNDIEDTTVLDLFAGSGAIGIEFLSRRAKQVYFCDKSSKAVAMIEKNLEKTKLKEKAIVYNKDYIDCINTVKPERDINRINNMNINYKIYDLRKYGRVSLIFLK